MGKASRPFPSRSFEGQGHFKCTECYARSYIPLLASISSFESPTRKRKLLQSLLSAIPRTEMCLKINYTETYRNRPGKKPARDVKAMSHQKQICVEQIEHVQSHSAADDMRMCLTGRSYQLSTVLTYRFGFRHNYKSINNFLIESRPKAPPERM